MPARKNLPRPLIIDDETLTLPAVKDAVFRPRVRQRTFGFGLVERDLAAWPWAAFGDPPAEMDLIPESDYDAYWEEAEAEGSSLQHLRDRGDGGQPIAALDQGTLPY